MRFSAFALLSLVSVAFAGNCGPQNGNAKCAANECCSQYGWCGTTVDHCDAKTCLHPFSGASSSCKPTQTTMKTSATKQATSPATTFPTAVPEIDVCGHAQGGVTCPGAGANGYFYRCCSSAGHCGPKNDIQDQALYCGDGCQAGYGKCDNQKAPAEPTAPKGTSGAGETCGPIVNKKCAAGLCCSGSNFCGTVATLKTKPLLQNTYSWQRQSISNPIPQPKTEYLFHGSGTVLKPCHITRYIYPSLCDYPLGCLRLQLPSNSSSRSRPQGSGSWGTDGHTFLSITNTQKLAPHSASFAEWSTRELERDRKSKNALARGMARMSLYVGNTVLEAGKFQLRRGEGMCFVVVRTWFTESEYACRLHCGHFLCLECLTQHVDSSAGRGKLLPGETDPLTKFFRCIECKSITALLVDRTAVTRPDELHWWRWKISMRRLEKEASEFWLVRLQTLPHSGWFRDIPQDWDTDRQVKEIRVHVRYDDAVAFMHVPKRVWAMLPYGFSLDNPVESCEALALEKCLKGELKRLSVERKLFNTKEILDHMANVGRGVLKPVVVEDVSARLGNPVTPPGYEAYRDFLCEWTARGVLMCPMGRMPILEFLRNMDKEGNKKKAWWKDVRDVFFDP
ncbi:hypothetical protein IG631_21107 [Alternaria alternata]|nr:hypothetical protein IG631_21107 [Alternaria alternata]